jgi:muconolactone delta-isomerase
MYSLAADRSRVWAVMNAKDEIEVMHLLADMPLIQYADPVVTELAFHNSVRFAFPAISLN